MSIRDYIAIARPDHWFKNIFVLPGIALAALLTKASLIDIILPVVFGLLSTCLIASANYVINEWLDAEFDRFHPEKKKRPAAMGKIKPTFVYLEYVILLLVGLGIASFISPYFLATEIFLAVMGVIYNVKPFRSKERAYLDVISESVNNPIRLALGWFMVTSNPLPPSSLLLTYWMGGAFLMGIKRYAEYRFINDAKTAGLYRRSFQFYTEEKLLVSSFFYAISSALFLGVFLVKYRIELLLSLPFFAILFTWYLYIGLKPNSPAQKPEKLLREKKLSAYLIFLFIIVVFLFSIDIPSLKWFLENAFIQHK